MGTELAGGPTGWIHLLRADIVVAIGQSVFRFDALCRPGSDLSAKPVGAEEGPGVGSGWGRPRPPGEGLRDILEPGPPPVMRALCGNTQPVGLPLRVPLIRALAI